MTLRISTTLIGLFIGFAAMFGIALQEANAQQGWALTNPGLWSGCGLPMPETAYLCITPGGPPQPSQCSSPAHVGRTSNCYAGPDFCGFDITEQYDRWTCQAAVVSPPTVNTFTDSPDPITLGDTTTLTWTNSGTVDSGGCTITNVMESITYSGRNANSNLVVTPGLTGLVRYRIQCNGPGGASNILFTEVTVNPPVIPNANPVMNLLSAPATGVTANPVSFDYRASDADGDTLRYEFDFNNNFLPDYRLPALATAPQNVTQKTTNTWNTPGTYSFHVRAQDAAGNFSSWMTETITISTPSPVTLTMNANGGGSSIIVTQGTPVTINWSVANATDCDGTAGPSFNGLDLPHTGSQSQPVGTPGIGVHTFSMLCTGPGASASRSVTVQVDPPAGPGCTMFGGRGIGAGTGPVPVAYTQIDSLFDVISGGANPAADQLACGNACEAAGADYCHFEIPVNSNTFECRGFTGGSVITAPITISFEGEGSGGGSGFFGWNAACGPSVSSPPTIVLESSGNDPHTITLGSDVVLNWTVTDADDCDVTSTAPGWSGDKSHTGYNTENIGKPPTGTHTYTLECSGPGGVADDSVVVTVNGGTPAPVGYTCTYEERNDRCDSSIPRCPFVTPGVRLAPGDTYFSGIGHCHRWATYPTSPCNAPEPSYTPGTGATLSCTNVTTRPSCPLAPAVPGSRWVVTDMWDIVLADDRSPVLDAHISPSYYPIPNGPMPIGNYEVTLVSFDPHTQFAFASQDKERFFVNVYDSGNGFIAASNPTTDLPETDDFLTQIVNTSGSPLSLTAAAASIRAEHPDFMLPAGDPQSLHPLCASFDLVSSPVTVDLQVESSDGPVNWTQGDPPLDISWNNSSNVTSCTASGSSNWIGSFVGATSRVGNDTHSPATNPAPRSITYRLTCDDGLGNSDFDEITVNVVAQPDPVINSFDATPVSVPYNGSSVLDWNVSGPPSTVCVGYGSGFNGPLSSLVDSDPTPSLNAYETYTIECNNGYGGLDVTESVTVRVRPRVTLWEDTWPSPLLYNAETTRLFWSVEGPAANCTGTGHGPWNGNKSAAGNPPGGDGPYGPFTTDVTFSMVCENADAEDGNTDTADVFIYPAVNGFTINGVPSPGPAQVIENDTATFSWDVAGPGTLSIQGVTVSGSNGSAPNNWQNTKSFPVDSQSVGPITVDSNYRIEVTRTDIVGSPTESLSNAIEVLYPSAGMTALPQQVLEGQSTSIDWSVENVQSYIIEELAPSPGVITQDAGPGPITTNSSFPTGAIFESTTYRLTADRLPPDPPLEVQITIVPFNPNFGEE